MALDVHALSRYTSRIVLPRYMYTSPHRVCPADATTADRRPTITQPREPALPIRTRRRSNNGKRHQGVRIRYYSINPSLKASSRKLLWFLFRVFGSDLCVIDRVRGCQQRKRRSIGPRLDALFVGGWLEAGIKAAKMAHLGN